MAQLNKRRTENIPGNFFVDDTCIDCDACRWIAPQVFHEKKDQSAVYHQPQNEHETESALRALVACPTSSIGTVEKIKELRGISKSFPLNIQDNVFYCGYHSKDSYGAASYFIQREEGNILIDSPRFAKSLVTQIERMGGVRFLYLTHRDDVADHKHFQKHFQCERILHADDVSKETEEVEIKIKGDSPYVLDEENIIIPVPGHTKGHTVLLYKNQFLFTGDHLAYSPALEHLYAFRNACWYSWPEVVTSMEKLNHYDFEWILPGHGRRLYAPKDKMKEEMKKCLKWMRTQN